MGCPTKEEIIEAMRTLFRALGREMDLDNALKEGAWPDVRVDPQDFTVLTDPAEAGSFLRRMLQEAKHRANEHRWTRRQHRDGSPATLFGGELGVPDVFMAPLRKHPPVKERKVADAVHPNFWRDTNTPRPIVPPPNRKRAVFRLVRPTDFSPAERRADCSLLEEIAHKTRPCLDYLRPATLNETLDLVSANPVILEYGALLVGASYSMSHAGETALPVVRRDRRGGIETAWMPASLIIGNEVRYANGLLPECWMMPFIQDQVGEKMRLVNLSSGATYMNVEYIERRLQNKRIQRVLQQRWSHRSRPEHELRPRFRHAPGYHSIRDMRSKGEHPFPFSDFKRWGPVIVESVFNGHRDDRRFVDTVVFTGSRCRFPDGKMHIPVLIVNGNDTLGLRTVPEETLFPGFRVDDVLSYATHFLTYVEG